MKRNAIARIIANSLLIVLLTGILLGGMGLSGFSFEDGETIEETPCLDAASVHELDIDWAAGKVMIQTSTDSSITVNVYEVGKEEQTRKAAWYISDKTLHIQYSKSNVNVGIFGIPEKNLVITVPENWVCEALQIDGASLEVCIDNLQAEKLELDGAAIELTYNGQFQELDCDGADCQLTLSSYTTPAKISVSGADCQMSLSLPAGSGFRVEADGLGCSISSNVNHTKEDGDYVYGDQSCQIDVEGMDCHADITIEGAGSN